MTGNDTTNDDRDDMNSGPREATLTQLTAGTSTPSQIAAASEMDVAHVSRALSDLRERSLVALLVSEDRKKGRIYRITDRGIEITNLIKEQEISIDD
jgi:DNA-binding MarR family transcriptional regulator